jgi:hypothetical protein
MDGAQSDSTAGEVGPRLADQERSRTGRSGRAASMLHAAGVALLAAAISISVRTTALAQPTDQTAAADTAFHEANRLMNEGKIAEACPKFAASHRLDPSYGAVYNLGTCYEKLGKTASAWAAFREAVELAKKQRETERVDKAARRAAALEPRLTRLRIAVATPLPGLSIERDGASVDPALWGSPIPVDPGTYTLSARAPGRLPWSKTVTVSKAGTTETIDLPVLGAASDAVPSPGASVDAGTSPASQSSMPVQRMFALGAAGVGVTALTVGTLFAVQSTATWDVARERHCNKKQVCDARGVALHGQARTMVDVATAGFIASGASLVAAGVLWLTAPVRQQKKTSHDFRVTPVVGTAGGGMLVTGSFQ